MAGGVLRLLVYYLDDQSATLIHDVDSEYKVETARIDSHRNKITHSAKALAGQIHAANQAVMYGADAEIARNREMLVQQMESIASTADRLQLPKLALELSPSITPIGDLNRFWLPCLSQACFICS
jgi:hypothetical protein